MQEQGLEESEIKSPEDLIGKICQTSLITNRGSIIAYVGTVIDIGLADEIWKRKSLREELVIGRRGSDVFLISQAEGTGLVDLEGNIY